MPNLANITIKKADGTTDITWTGMLGSAGDKIAALWRSLTVGSAPAFQPTATVVSRENGPKTARRVNIEVVYPYTTTGSDGKTYLADKAVFTGSFLLPNGMPSSVSDEAAVQSANLIASSLFKEQLKSGFAAN